MALQDGDLDLDLGLGLVGCARSPGWVYVFVM